MTGEASPEEITSYVRFENTPLSRTFAAECAAHVEASFDERSLSFDDFLALFFDSSQTVRLSTHDISLPVPSNQQLVVHWSAEDSPTRLAESAVASRVEKLGIGGEVEKLSPWLRKLTQLEELEVGWFLDPQAAAEIAHLPKLRILEAALWYGLPSESLAPWVNLDRLERLKLSAGAEGHLKYIARLPALRSLKYANDGAIGDFGLRQFRGVRKLEFLELAKCEGVTCNGLASLVDCPVLTELSLQGLPITRAEWTKLKQLKSLKKIGGIDLPSAGANLESVQDAFAP